MLNADGNPVKIILKIMALKANFTLKLT